MEKKVKPEVPVKPHTLSVSDKARNFERIAASLNVERKPFKFHKNEKIIKEPDTQIRVVNSYVEIDVSSTYGATVEAEFNDDSSDESSDDSIYYETPESPEHIYDEISEDTGVSNTVEEILANEKSYIDRLNYMIDNYVESSRVMGEQMLVIFGNVEEIKRFHENTFYPDLQRCNKELIQILECFSRHIKDGNFYSYVVYAMNKKKSDDARNIPVFKDFFKERQNEINDKLGLNSYLTEPFQRFFKYQNLIESVLKKIGKINFMEIAATSKALNDVKKLLNTANKSMALTDIVDSKINLMNQGNFLTQSEFNIFDHNHKRKYKGKIFLFQKCVVCTESMSSAKLQFKSYFPNRTGLIECVNQNRFILFERNNYKIEVSGDSNLIQQWVEQVREVLTPVASEEVTVSNGNASENASTNSNANTNANTSKSTEYKKRISKDLEALFDANLKRNTSSDSLCDHSDKESNTISIEYRKSNSDYSSADSGEYQTDGSIEKLPFREMIRSIDKFYEKVTNKNPLPATVPDETPNEKVTNKNPLAAIASDEMPNEMITFPKSTANEIIQEMLANETNYIGQLTIGIQNYLATENINDTKSFLEKVFKIFGNIQQIKEFHENTYYSALKDCENDVTKIANVFSKFTQEGLFSNYILYAMNHNNTQSLRIMKPYREFFEARQKDVGDNQGVEYYLFLPFKHLSMYQHYMERIIDTLNIETETSKMAACSKARKHMERLIRDMHSSWTSADVHTRRRPIRKFSTLFANGIPHNIFKRN